MHGQPEGRRKLPVEMKLREGRNTAHRVQVQFAVEMPVDIVQHSPHPGLIVLQRRLHRPSPWRLQLVADGHHVLDRSAVWHHAIAKSIQSAHSLPLHAADPCYILNPMVQFQRAHLDASFAALSDATRRGILERLGRADASITDLAEKFHMTLTGMKKHVGVLEQAGLVTTEKVGRVRTCKLGLRRLEEEAAWIERYRQLWDARFDELDKIVESLKREERVDGRKKRK